MHAITQEAFGGPEVLRYREVPDPEPGPGQLRIEVGAAGVVDAVGPDTDAGWVGRTVVVHLGPASGGYATEAVAAAADVFPLPDGADLTAAVAMVGTGRTALG